MKKKVLVLDGISGVSLARDIGAAADKQLYDVDYCDLAALSPIFLHKPRSAIAKLKNKKANKDSFFYLPKKRIAELADILKEKKPDIILVIGFVYRFIAPSQLRQLAERYSCKLFLYDTDSCNLYSNRREFIYFLEQEMSLYDRVFSFSNVMTEFLIRKGFAAEFAPFGANLVVTESSEYQHDVLFVGSADLRRVFLLEHIVKYLTVFGQRWKRNRPLMSLALQEKVDDKQVWGATLQQHLKGAKIVLNITRGPFYAAETGINLRIFEALAAGCFVLTDYCDEVAELLEPGKDIETFSGSEELAEKVAFYLENDDARQAIAKQGHQTFIERFTWQKRVSDMFSKMDA